MIGVESLMYCEYKKIKRQKREVYFACFILYIQESYLFFFTQTIYPYLFPQGARFVVCI
jgi:hypothetical protein